MKNPKNQSLRRQPCLSALKHGALAIALLFAWKADAQPSSYTSTHDFGVDVKNYSGHVVTDQSIMYEDVMYAGTIYNYPSSGRNIPHHVLVDYWGNVLNNQAYDFSAEYKDIRSVDITGQEPYPTRIVSSGSLTYFNVCLARPDDDIRINTSKGVNDRILVIPVHNTGAIMPGKVAYSIKSPIDDEGLYPISSYYDYSNNALYICGYITDNRTSLPNTPGYTTNGNHRKAFVLRVDNPSSTTPSVTKTITIDTEYPFHPNLTFNEDYDIAMRITKTCTGDLHITGSVNNVKTNGVPPVGPFIDPIYRQYSATMNIVLDQDLVYVAGEHYGLEYAPNTTAPYSQHEYGTAFLQENNLNITGACIGNQNNYVMSNYFVHNTGVSAVGPYPTFDPQPTYMHFTHLESSSSSTPYMYNIGVNSRMTFGSLNAQWGLQLCNNYSGYASGADFGVTGMTTEEYCGATGASLSNVLPFLMNVSLGYASSVGIYGWYRKRISFQTASLTAGTGPYPSATNSYPLLGGGLSNWAWNPTPAAWTFNGLYSFSAPRYTAGNQLGLKTVKTDGWATIEPTCGISSYKEYIPNPACPDGRVYEEVRGLGIPGTTPGGWPAMVPFNNQYGTLGSLNPLVITTEGATLSPLSWTSTTCTSGSPNYKTGTTGISANNLTTGETTVYPNPASDYVKVTPEKGIPADAEMTVKLYNMMGALVATLYNGKAGNLAEAKLTLPQVATGLYIVRVNAGEKMIANQKIQIQ